MAVRAAAALDACRTDKTIVALQRWQGGRESVWVLPCISGNVPRVGASATVSSLKRSGGGEGPQCGESFVISSYRRSPLLIVQ